MSSETPSTVYGRLLEAVHISGYTLERAIAECLWLLKEGRWESIGSGFKSKSEFVASIDLTEFKIAAERRKEFARLLANESVSQRATAKALGVGEQTVARALGKSRRGSAPLGAGVNGDGGDSKTNSRPSAPLGAPPPYDPDPSGGRKAAAAQQTKAHRAERELTREQQRQENAARVSHISNPRELLKVGRFSTIVIDPPWDLGDEGDVNQMGRAKPDFATMPIDDVLALPVDTLSDTDCHIYLWITNRSLPKGFRLLDAWGFRYVTCLTWVKPSLGMGNYFRGQTEQILFGVKGSLPLKRKDAGTVIHAPRGGGGHSSKPAEFYELVETCSPKPYLEMFSRKPREGWTAWGEESQVADVGE